MAGAEAMVRKNFFLPPQLIARLEEHATRLGTPVSEHVRRALQEYLERK